MKPSDFFFFYGTGTQVHNCFGTEFAFKNAWIQGGEIIARHYVGKEDKTCLDYCCETPKCNSAVIFENGTLCYTIKCTKRSACNLTPSDKHRKGSWVFIPRRGLPQRGKSNDLRDGSFLTPSYLDTGSWLTTDDDVKESSSKKQNESHLRKSVDSLQIKSNTKSLATYLQTGKRNSSITKRQDSINFSKFITVPQCKLVRTLNDFIPASLLHNRSRFHRQRTKSWHECVDLCCGDLLCSTALLVNEQCFAVYCDALNECKRVKINRKDLRYKKIKLGIVLRTTKNPRLPRGFSFPVAASSDEISKEETFHLNTKRALKDFALSSFFPSSREGHVKDVPKCSRKVVLRNVRLKHGRKFATFERRGVVGSVDKCINMCCKKRWCDLAFKAGKYCYSVHCPSKEACLPIHTKQNSELFSDYVLLNRPLDTDSSKKCFIFVLFICYTVKLVFRDSYDKCSYFVSLILL